MHKYDCPVKQAHREVVASAFAAFKGPAATRALILAGTRPWELLTLLGRGFKADNIYAVDVNRAVGANFTRAAERHAIPLCRRAWVSLAEVAKTLAATAWRFDVAHLDFDGVSTEAVRDVVDVLARESLVGVTWLGCREVEGTMALRARGLRTAPAGDETLEDRGRFRAVYESLRLFETVEDVQLQDSGRYYNTVATTPMIWALYRVTKRESRL